MFVLLAYLLLNLTVLSTGQSILCPVLTKPEHGYLVHDYCNRENGSFCGFGCLSGYRLAGGDSFRECQDDGTWTGESPTCAEIRCSPLKINSDIIQDCSPKQNTTNYIFGTKCRASCNKTGYRLAGLQVRECLILGIWSGYEQFCIVDTDITTQKSTTSTMSTQSSTKIVSKYNDYTKYALMINSNNTGITLKSFQTSTFTIIFWFYLQNSTNTVLLSMNKQNDINQFEILVRHNKLTFHFSSRNQTQPTSIQIPSLKWTHFAWIYSNKAQQSYLYIDGARQQTFDLGLIKFNFENVSSLILFNRLFRGSITRLEIWNEMLSERQLLVSYRDCRKQNGNIFSWSKVSDGIVIETSRLKSSDFCSGCSEPASIHGGTYRVSDYDIGSTVTYTCNFGHELIGAKQAVCMVPSEWYPRPPTCKYNPCSTECDLCEKKTGVCLRQQTKKPMADQCDPPCEDNEECIDGECVWTNTQICKPPCPIGVQCVNGKCLFNSASQCSIPCRSDQFCIDGRCGCYRGLCESSNRSCYEICHHGERCFNMSCSCGIKGKCQSGEICSMDICLCGTKRGGCRSNEHCVHGRCVYKTNNRDPCENKCQTNETCLNGKCVCKENRSKAFCPFPCLHGGRCTGFYECTCRQGWQGHRCERLQISNNNNN